VTTQKRTWLKDYPEALKGADVVIIPDLDQAGSEHTQKVVDKIYGSASRVRVLTLPGLDDVEGGDVTDWLAKGGTVDELRQLIEQAPEAKPTGYTLDDFSAYMPSHNYIFHPTRELWPASSVDKTLSWIDTGEVRKKKVAGEDVDQPVLMAPTNQFRRLMLKVCRVFRRCIYRGVCATGTRSPDIRRMVLCYFKLLLFYCRVEGARSYGSTAADVHHPSCRFGQPVPLSGS
jgi:hypothetical protein